MKKRLKILCTYVLSISILLANSLCVMAADNSKNCQQEISALTGLGIITGYSEAAYVNRKSITYNDFLSYVVNARYAGALSGSALDIAKTENLIDDEDNIKSASAVNAEIAVKAVVRALGYEPLMKLENTTYLKIATDIGLLDGVTIRTGEKLDSDNMLKMLYNMLDVKLFARVGISDSYKQIDATVISKFHKIKKVSGIVTANEFTGIYAQEESREGYVRIGETYYETNGVDYNNLLGMNVDVYYYDDDLILKCVLPKANKNEEIVISADLFEDVNTNVTQIRYYKEESSSRLVTKNFNTGLKVVYNGKVYKNYNASLFDVGEGNIRILDNDGDGKYDFAFITDYELIFVSKANASTQVIFSEYDLQPWTGNEQNLKKLDFSQLKLNKELFIYQDGKKTDFSAITQNDVIFMERNADATLPLVKLHIIRQSQNLDVDSINWAEGEITSEKTTYKINKDYAAIINSGSADAVRPELGYTYIFFFDMNGKIAGAVKTGAAGENYVVIYGIAENESEDEIIIKYVDRDNEHHKAALSNKVKIGKDTYKNSQAAKAAADALFGQVARLKLDKEGKIKTIETASLQASTDANDTFNYAQKQTLPYRSGVGTVSFGGKYYVDGNTIIFATTNNTSKYSEDWSKVMLSRAYLRDNQSYTITPYLIDEYGYTKIILLEASTAHKTLNILVSAINQGLDKDDVPVTNLCGPVGNIVELAVPALDGSVYAGIKKGDYVSLSIDYKGNATNASKIYTPQNGIKYERPDDSSFYYGSVRYMGTLSKINYGAKRMQLYCGPTAAVKNFDLQWLEPSIYIYDGKTVSIGTLDDLEVGNMMVITTSYDRPSVIIVYK